MITQTNQLPPRLIWLKISHKKPNFNRISRQGRKTLSTTLNIVEQKKALDIKIKNFGKSIWCYSPSIQTYSIDQHKPADNFRFCPISITGSKCQLQCDHCRGQILESMFPAETPERLEALINNFVSKGTEGILISGGSRLDGTVPLLKFIPTLKKIKEKYDLSIVMHLSLIHI